MHLGAKEHLSIADIDIEIDTDDLSITMLLQKQNHLCLFLEVSLSA